MRTNIEIDDKLMRAARKARPGATKRALVEDGLRLLALMAQQEELRKLRGRLAWEGDLESMRRDPS